MATLKSVRRLGTDGYRYAKFEAMFDREPTRQEVTEAQLEAGYHPAGYGPPHSIVSVPRGNEVVTTFQCAGSCD